MAEFKNYLFQYKVIRNKSRMYIMMYFSSDAKLLFGNMKASKHNVSRKNTRAKLRIFRETQVKLG